MPTRHAGTGVGDNLSPPLVIAGVPEETATLLLILQDPDAPIPRPVVHLIAQLAPATRELAEGALNPGRPVCFGRGSFGHFGYAGPRPVPGHGPHRYIFQLFALTRVPPCAPDAGLKDYLAASAGYAAARGMLTGTYER
jgi:Raf kinase inhibitor-like YbhB/YbcL family protein